MTIIYKKLADINSNKILELYESINKEILWLTNDKGRQSSLQYELGQEQFLSGCGTTNGTDSRQNHLVDLYKGTLLEDYIRQYNLVRTRWMWMAPFACYSVHSDIFPRIHFPILTNRRCYFLFPECTEFQSFNLHSNAIWWVNTRQPHTFINCSNEWRLHLVGSSLQ